MAGATRTSFLILSTAALSLGGCGQEDRTDVRYESAADLPPHAAAAVNTQLITKTSVRHWTQVAENQEEGRADPRKLRAEVMEFLLQGVWVEQEAARRNLHVDEAEAKQALKDQKEASFPSERSYRKLLAASGMSNEDILVRVRLDMLQQSITKAVVRSVATSPEISQYDSVNKARRIRNSRRKARVLRSFIRAFSRRYEHRTVCARAYRVAECKGGRRLTRSAIRRKASR